MKKRSIFLPLLICIAAAFFACGIFAISNTKDRGQTVTAQAETAITTTIYWSLSGNTLTFSATELSTGTTGSFDGIAGIENKFKLPWRDKISQITTVNIATPIAPQSTAFWFASLENLTTIEHLENLDTSHVTTFLAMFYESTSIESLDLSTFDTSQVTSMQSMFSFCTALTEVNLSSFDTSNVISMDTMFGVCPKLKKIDLSNFDTSNVTTMQEIFYGCSALTELDLSNFDASSLLVTETSTSTFPIWNMLYGLQSLQKLKLSDTLAKRIAFEKNSSHTSAIPLPLYYEDSATAYNTESQINKGGAYYKTRHTHDYKETSRDNATCTTDGTKYFNCSESFCDAAKTEKIPATGQHNYGEGEVTKQASCSEAGERTYTCAECGNTQTETISKLDHVWSETWTKTKDPTEDEEGEEQCQCTNCTEVKTRPIDRLPHTHKFAEGWTSDETKHWHAPTCGHNVKEGEAAHSWNDGEITKEATCTAEGVKTFTCTVCNKTRTETIDKIAHTPGDAANCTTAQTCTVCGFELAAKLGHNYEAAEGGVAPTCTTAGSGKVVCTRCNDEQVGASIPALGHNPGTAATCTESQTCTVCNTELAPALGHDWATEWSKDETNHWHICNRCDEKNDEAAHTYDWVITKDPTEEEEGVKEEYCTVCDYANGNKETLAKLVVDDNGSVSDLPKLPDNQDYDLEIAVKESESKYNIEGLNKGYLVELFIVDGEDRNPYDDTKTVTLTLLVPDGMEDFTLYRMSGDRLTEISAEEYTVNDGVVTIRTTLPSEFVFNAPIPEQPSAGIPWWVWLIVGLVVVAIVGVVIVIIVVAKKKNGNNGGDTEELKAQLAEQGEKIDELLGRDDGGFNTPVELDENGNVIFK